MYCQNCGIRAPTKNVAFYQNIGALIMNRSNRTDGDTARAIDAFRKALQIKPDYGPAYRELAYALIGAGDRPGAAQALKDYLRVSPSAADAGTVQQLLKALAG